MKLIYVAGPFSAPTREGVEANIARAVRLGLEVARIGCMPVIPHANTAHPDFEMLQPYQFWIDGTIELLRRCHAVILTENWEISSGARAEKADAESRGQPVFFTVAELEKWNQETGSRVLSRCATLEDAAGEIERGLL